MTTKAAIIATVILLIGTIALGIVLILFFIDTDGPNADERGAAFGRGMGTLVLLPLAIIWFMWAARVAKERERKNRSRSSRR